MLVWSATDLHVRIKLADDGRLQLCWS